MPAQRHGERIVVRDQTRHLPDDVLDLPPQGRDLRSVLRPLPLVYRADNSRKALVNCRSNAVIPFPHSLDSFKAGRPSTVQSGLLNVPAGSTTYPLVPIISETTSLLSWCRGGRSGEMTRMPDAVEVDVVAGSV